MSSGRLASLGAALIAIALTLPWLGTLVDRSGPEVAASASLETAETTAIRRSTDGVAEQLELHTEYRITYPARMNRGDARAIELVVDGRAEVLSVAAGGEEARRRLEDPVEIDHSGGVRLLTASFELAPEATIEKPAGTRLPTTYRWTIAPRSAGAHHVLLDLSAFLPEEPSNPILIVDGERKDLSDEVVLLDIKVNTRWGVLKGFLNSARSVVGLIGLVFSYPWSSRRLRGLLQKRAGGRRAGF